MWAENAQTAEGRVLHERVHQAASETVDGVRVARGLRLCSRELGLFGVADVVEFHPRREHDDDRRRRRCPAAGPLAAVSRRIQTRPPQAGNVLLRATLRPGPVPGRNARDQVPAGALYHGKSRRRQAGRPSTPPPRTRTWSAGPQLHELIAAGRVRRRPSTARSAILLAGRKCVPKLPPSRLGARYSGRAAIEDDPCRDGGTDRMKKHDNTLYVTTQGAYLAREGTNVLVRVEKETRLRVPMHNLGGIVCFGNVGCSPFLMGMCGQRGRGVSFLTENGRFLARVLGPQSGNVLLRRAQHRKTTDPAATADFARSVISAKIANARAVLQRAARDHADRVFPGADRDLGRTPGRPAAATCSSRCRWTGSAARKARRPGATSWPSTS